MTKRILVFAVATIMSLSLVGCNDVPNPVILPEKENISSQVTVVGEEELVKPVTDENYGEAEEPADTSNMYRSELTNEWIDLSLKDQRPIAVMVDNEKIALPHYGVNDCDIVYELMNSTENDRVTRLMCIMKDWGSVKQLGSIRSARPSNFMLTAEYNAIFIHDGGPGCYINEYIAKPYINNLSGGFARFSNGKPTEFTEYVTAEKYTNEAKGQSYSGLLTRIDDANIKTNYTSYYEGPHFSFNDKEFGLSSNANAKDATKVELPFPHNGSWLFYNEETRTYDYYEYNEAHVDALTNEQTSFKNVILYSCPFEPCEERGHKDENGYIVYSLVGSGEGYYLTNGKAIPISWSKASESGITKFTDKATGEELVLNTGKIYIGIVPADVWDELAIR